MGFLTGEPADVREVAQRYGVAVAGRRTARSTTRCSRRWSTGTAAMRVQYLGYRFDPEEFRRDLLGLLNEP